MKVVDAVWEQRNLGLTTAEVQVGVQDSIDDLYASLTSLDKRFDYICLKCDSRAPELLYSLPELGYRFIETQFALKFESKNFAVFPNALALNDVYGKAVTARQIEEDQFDVLLELLEKEHMFKTDRIYLDHFFPREAAGRRYAGWCRDLKDRGAIFLETLYDGEPVGFYEYQREQNGAWNTALGGMYPESNEYAYLTPVFNQYLLNRFMKDGMKTMHSAVSSNNSVILKLHLSVGYQISNVAYVYVKHNGER